MKAINFITSNELKSSLKYKGIARYMPLIICGGFYLLTILLFIFGPYDWHISRPAPLYTFLFMTLFALIIGYITASFIKRKKIVKNYNVNKIIFLSFLIFIVLYVFNTYTSTGKFYPDIIRGIFDSGTAYRISHSSTSSLSTILTYINIILTPITSFLTPLFFIYYKSLSKRSKVLGIICLVLNLFLGIAQGVINSYATFVFQVCLYLVLYIFSTIGNKKTKEKVFLFFIILLLLFSFLFYYKTVMSNRLIADATSGNEVIETTEETFDNDKINDMFNASATFEFSTLKENHLLSFLPDSISGSTNHIISYITHGYKGLSLAMDENFTSSYGLGFSDFFRHNILKLIGQSDQEGKLYERTYMYKIEDSGWRTGAIWSTFFIFPASDIGFAFTIVLVFIIGFIFNLSWRDALESKNIFAAVIFSNLCIMICFFCANNALFQNGGTFITMMVMTISWILTRKVKEGR